MHVGTVEEQVLAHDDVDEVPRPGIHLLTVAFEACGDRGLAQIDERRRTTGTCQQDAGLLEGLPQRRHPVRDAACGHAERPTRSDVGEVLDRGIGARGGIVGIDRSSGEDPHVAHEDRARVAFEHEHVHVGSLVADENRRSGSHRHRVGIEHRIGHGAPP